PPRRRPGGVRRLGRVLVRPRGRARLRPGPARRAGRTSRTAHACGPVVVDCQTCRSSGSTWTRRSQPGGRPLPDTLPDSCALLDRLDSLGWTARASTAHVTMSADHARTIARLVVDTATAVFGLPHPVFLNDAPGPTPHAPVDPDPDRDPGTDHVDFRPLPISCP